MLQSLLEDDSVSPISLHPICEDCVLMPDFALRFLEEFHLKDSDVISIWKCCVLFLYFLLMYMFHFLWKKNVYIGEVIIIEISLLIYTFIIRKTDCILCNNLFLNIFICKAEATYSCNELRYKCIRIKNYDIVKINFK